MTRRRRPAAPDPAPTPEGDPGTLVAHFGVAVDVVLDSGERRSVRVKRRSGHVVGDRVSIADDRLTRLPRDNELRRRSPGGGVHVVAANLDLLCVVVASEPPPRVGLVDRCAVAARAAGIDCALVINKADLAGAAAARDLLRPIFEGAMPVLEVSATSGAGTDALRELIAEAGKTILSGHSGVGKSSLSNTLVPGLRLDVGALSDASGRGKHTTTTATLHPLPSGGELVDTPGIREFGLVDVAPLDLAAHFVGFERVGACRFRDCLHDGEPDCAVAQGVAAGELAAERRDAYRALLAEVRDQLDGV